MNPNNTTSLSQHYLQIQALTPVSGQSSPISQAPLSTNTLQRYTSTIIIVFIGLMVVGSLGLIITKTKYINKLLVVMFIAFITSAIPLSLNTLSHKQHVSTLAGADHVPVNLKVTQVTSSSFAIMWDTNKPSIGTVRYWRANEVDTYKKIISENDSGEIYKHFLILKDLQPATTYLLEILSGGEWYNNHGEPLKITTLP